MTVVGDGRWRTRLIQPPARPYPLVRGLAVMARNPAQWWSEGMYDDGLYRVRLMGRQFVHVARPEFARQVLLDDNAAFGRSFVAQRALEPLMGNGLLTSDGDVWRRQRRLLAPLFRATSLERHLPAMDRHARACRDALLSRCACTEAILPHTARAALDIIVATLFGDAELDRVAIAADVDEYLIRLGRPDPLALLGLPDAVPRPGRRRGLAAVARLRARCHRVIEARRADARGSMPDDLLGRLLQASDPDTGERLDTQAIVDNVVTFVGAGHETTAVALAWTLYAIAHQPDLAERLAQESRDVLGDAPATAECLARLDLHRRVLQETMRLYPPAAAVVRSVRQEVRVGDHELVPGDHVTIATMPMHRNPRYWPEPDAFDAERFVPDAQAQRDRFAYLPFGGGPRVCIGAGFAMTEAIVVLSRLTPALRFAVPPGKPPVPILSITLRPSNGMPLTVARRD